MQALTEKASATILEGRDFAFRVRLPPKFNSPETKVYLKGQGGLVKAYAPSDLCYTDTMLDSKMLSETKIVNINSRQVSVREFIMPVMPLDAALAWLEKALGNGRMPNLTNKRRKTLDSDYLRDITALAEKGELSPVIGRDKEIELMSLVLQRKKKANPVLVGKPGVGKTAIVEGLAQRIAAGDVPHTLGISTILELSILKLMANRGELERRIIDLIGIARRKGVVLFIDEIHTIMRADSTVKLADAIKPMIANGEMRIMGATTPIEYRSIEQDRALERRFVRIDVEEPSDEETREILLGAKGSYESYHSVSVSPDLIDDIMHVARRHLPQRQFPDKAIEILDMGCSVCKTKGLQSMEKTHILEGASRISGIPVDDDASKVLMFSSYLRQRIIGQDEALEEISSAIQAKMAGLDDKPLGFLLVGPTGVGKTETGRVLAELLFNSPDSLIRIDMSEFREEHTISKLIGAPPGYVGYDQGGILTEAVKSKPYSVVLFDEIGKSHPSISTILLQILDAGRLTDSSGMTVNFRETLVVLTSNQSYSELRGFFRPELLGRLRVVSYRSLTEEDMLEIAKKEMDDLKSRLADRNLELTYDDEVLVYLASLDSEYGVRELKQAIDTEIVSPISYMLLHGTRKVAVGVENNMITLGG